MEGYSKPNLKYTEYQMIIEAKPVTISGYTGKQNETSFQIYNKKAQIF